MPSDFSGAFDALRNILKKHAEGMTALNDTPTDFTLITAAIAPNGKPMWFAAVKTNKSAVTFHLMPIYFNPHLQAQVPPELLKRQQGKTCFNFQKPEPALFAMLDTLTAQGREHFRRHGFLDPAPITAQSLDSALRAGGTDTKALAKLRKSKGAAAAKKRAATIAGRRKAK